MKGRDKPLCRRLIMKKRHSLQLKVQHLTAMNHQKCYKYRAKSHVSFSSAAPLVKGSSPNFTLRSQEKRFRRGIYLLICSFSHLWQTCKPLSNQARIVSLRPMQTWIPIRSSKTWSKRLYLNRIRGRKFDPSVKKATYTRH
jgi:hypothetical protein